MGRGSTEPGADLAVAMAVIGAVHDAPIGRDVVVLGELGLAGEVRQVAQTPRRLAEAARLGYRRAIVPARAPDVDGIRNIPVETLADAVIAVHDRASVVAP